MLKIKDDLDVFIGKANNSILEAMEKIDKNGCRILLLINDKEELVATLSDGDIRRFLVRNGDINSNIGDIANYCPKYVYEDDKNKVEEFLATGIAAVPVVNKERKIIEIIINGFNSAFQTTQHVDRDDIKDVDIIIMAGGKGTRLYPYTKILPKPLIPIGESPILERIINGFVSRGAQRIILIVNYKKEMIKAYFSEFNTEASSIEFVEEEKPLGTAGGLGLVKKDLSNPVIVTNCDIIVRTDYGDIIRYHKANENDMTIVSSLKRTVIQYGVVHTNKDGTVEDIEEKPEISFMINTGMYVLNPSCIDLIPEDKYYNMDEFTRELINKKKKVGIYPVAERAFWDMGEFEEMKRMEKMIEENKL